MKSNYFEKLKLALQAIELQSSSSFSWFGKKEASLPPKLKGKLPPEILRAYLSNKIESLLYSQFYCLGGATPLEFQPTTPKIGLSKKVSFISDLSDANKGKGYLDSDWKVLSVGNDHLIIEKNGVRFNAEKQLCFFHEDNSIKPGMSVKFQLPKEYPNRFPGFFLVVSDQLFSWGNDQDIFRLYWNFRPEGVPKFVEEITTKFNNDQLPFRLKCLNHPNQYSRHDSAILYLYKSDYQRMRKTLEDIHAGCLPYLKNAVPVFTKPLSLGLGLAEDPLEGISFGIHRCRMIAEGLIRAFERGNRSLNERLSIVESCFHENSIDLAAPYLNPNSKDIFNFNSKSKILVKSDEKIHCSESDGLIFLRTAHEIGKLLAKKASWYNGRCNWLGMDLYHKNHLHQDSSQMVFKALGPEIYSGTGGIALFLAELYIATGDSDIRNTAIGAVLHALSKSIPSGSLGFYDGLLGTVYTAVYLGKLLKEDSLAIKAADILNLALKQNREYLYLDQISGNAGIITALLILKDLLEDFSLLDFAIDSGNELLQKAHQNKEQCSWQSINSPKELDLLGFSHGTAGIAVALLELYQATGNEQYRTVANQAFNYERSLYNAKKRNWPDLRGITKSNRKTNELSCPTFWCHGAPGAALSRIRAYKILGCGTYKSEALIALNTTYNWTEQVLNTPNLSFSLCHGLAGNSDILLHGSENFGSEFSIGNHLAKKVADEGINRYAKKNNKWPFDNRGDQFPGLLVGLAGVGHFYLRLYDTKIPSILLLEREKILERLDQL